MLESMQLESINIGKAEKIQHGARSMISGIAKRPVAASAVIDEHGVRGDAVVDTEHHGGVDQAVYAYSADDYDWWRENTTFDAGPGQFGENLTIRGLPSNMNVGDRLLIREVVLEATSPRIPCSTLAIHMQDSSIGIAFREAERPGIYFRVLSGGEVSAGDSVTYIPDRNSDVSIVDLFRLNYARRHDDAELERVLKAPLAVRFRNKIETRLAGSGQ